MSGTIPAKEAPRPSNTSQSKGKTDVLKPAGNGAVVTAKKAPQITPITLHVPSSSPASPYAYSSQSEAAREEASKELRLAIRNFSTTPEPGNSSADLTNFSFAIAAGHHISPQRRIDEGIGLTVPRATAMGGGGAALPAGVGGQLAGGVGALLGSSSATGYIPPAKAMLVSKGGAYGLGAPSNSTAASRTSPTFANTFSASPPLPTIILPPLPIGSAARADTRRPIVAHSDSAAADRDERAGLEKGHHRNNLVMSMLQTNQAQRKDDEKTSSKHSLGKRNGGGQPTLSSSPVIQKTDLSGLSDDGAVSHTVSKGSRQHQQKKILVPLRKRRNVPSSNGTSAFTANANMDAVAAAMLVLREEEDLEQETLRTREEERGVDGPVGAARARASPSLLPPLKTATQDQQSSRGSPAAPSSPKIRTGEGNSNSVDGEISKATASLGLIRDSIKKNEEKIKEAYQRALALRNGGTANNNNDLHEGKSKDTSGFGAFAHTSGAMRIIHAVQREAFETYQKAAAAKLVEGREAPMFRSPKAFRVVGGPKSVVGQKLFELRADPSKWYDFTDNVAKLRKEKLQASLTMGAFMAENASPARLRSYSPEQKLPSLISKAEERDSRLTAAAEKRVELRLMQLESIEEKARQRQERINSRVTQWMTVVILGATAAKLKTALDMHRAEVETMAKKNAVAVFELMWRKRGFQMSYARAFVIRARFLRRVLTRIRSRIMTNRYADRCKNLLLNVTFYTRILVAFSHFHRRVVRGQRLWRARKDMIRLQEELRKMQWEDTAKRRAADIVMHIGRLKAERGLRGGSHASGMMSNEAPVRKLSDLSSASAFANPDTKRNSHQAPYSNVGGGRGGLRVTTLGAVMLSNARNGSLSFAPAVDDAKAVAGRTTSLARGSTSSSAMPRPADDPLVAAETELEDLRSITSETRDNMLANYLDNQRKQFRLAWRKREEYIVTLRKPEITSNHRELASRRGAIPPKPRWRMILPDEVIVNMVRQATRQQRNGGAGGVSGRGGSESVSGTSSFSLTPFSAPLSGIR